MHGAAREFRLTPAGGGHGLACDENGAFIDSIPLLKRESDAWEPRGADELST